ncbi:hypothetical protein ABIB17_003650 [Arthrobacter sp. UYEF6]
MNRASKLAATLGGHSRDGRASRRRGLSDRTPILPVFHELDIDEMNRIIASIRAATGEVGA